jgi:4-azaleucine resistance transporter AzlC
MKFTREFKKGFIRGLPIAFGYIPIAISYGLIAKSYNIPNEAIVLMSMMVFAGASQFIAINLINSGIGMVEIIITTFFVNLRHLLMSSSISEKIKDKVQQSWMPLLAFGITDETFSFISMTPTDNLSEGYIFGINFVSYSSWVLGTILGLFLSTSLPAIVQTSMGISLYAMFIALLIPNIKDHLPLMTVTLIAMAISGMFYYLPLFSFLSTGWSTVLVIIISSSLGAYLYGEEVDSID